MKTTDKGMRVSGATILIAWHACFPNTPRSDSTSFVELAKQVQQRFPFSWQTIMQMADRHTEAGTYEDRGHNLRQRMLAGDYLPEDFPELAKGGDHV